ncbi:MAG: hypothetical protein M0R28_17995 [Pigmentiphaga sp.]|nr:hypothetical protein [Pigmentiphaga sp.]
MPKPTPLTPEQIAKLSPLVRDLVVALRDAGFETTDSGDGSNYAAGMECAVPFKMVAIVCRPSELATTADLLCAWVREHATEYGLPDWGAYQITAQYSPVDGIATVMLAELSSESLDQIEIITGVRPVGLC